MNERLLDVLVCPECGADFGSEASSNPRGADCGILSCPCGHRFPVVDGVPRLLPGAQITADARAIQLSFSREWRYFDYRRDRAWAFTSDERRAAVLDQLAIPAESLEGRLVLDAGCGVGVLSTAISTYGCEVVAADIGHQVIDAQRHYSALGCERTYFVQADLMRPPFRPATFDVIYCGGVLHHTPDTRSTFDRLVPALAPGGKMFVWLYHHVAGLGYDLRMGARHVIVRLPEPVRHAVLLGLVPQAMARQHLRIARGTQSRESRRNAREKLVTMLDTYTCRYRWEHTPAEVHGWYRDHGLVDIRTTDVGKWGFGVVATRPALTQAERSDRTLAATRRM